MVRWLLADGALDIQTECDGHDEGGKQTDQEYGNRPKNLSR